MMKEKKEKQQKKRKKDGESTRDLMGITRLTEYSIGTKVGDIVFFIIKPTNISVLPDTSVTARIHSLLNVLKGQADVEMMALNSTESFESNKSFYRERMEREDLMAVHKLLELDSNHLDRIQSLTASAREFFIMVRIHNAKESEIFPYLSRLEKNIKDNGFITRRADEQDLKRILGVYFEQIVAVERFPDYDGEQWIGGVM